MKAERNVATPLETISAPGCVCPAYTSAPGESIVPPFRMQSFSLAPQAAHPSPAVGMCRKPPPLTTNWPWPPRLLPSTTPGAVTDALAMVIVPEPVPLLAAPLLPTKIAPLATVREPPVTATVPVLLFMPTKRLPMVAVTVPEARFRLPVPLVRPMTISGAETAPPLVTVSAPSRR